VADGAVFGGLAMWYAGHGDDQVLCAVSIFCLASGQVVSYTKARGEAIGLPVKVNGLVERAERLVITSGAVRLAGFHHTFGVPGIQVLLPIALWVVAVGSLVTLVQRVSRSAASPPRPMPRSSGRPRTTGAAREGTPHRRPVRTGLGRCPHASRAGRPGARPRHRRPGLAAARQGRPTAGGESGAGGADAGPEALRELSKAGMRSYLRYWMESFRLPAGARTASAAASTPRTCTT